ncbi:glycoside hydrolase family 28 protein [Mangrovibacterium lignilyticum]|uniref:glycoside hydrolase family 28 protein n=1 Tax=Mangrovibacterium lignilyticum TaxID=2668052 RepID=UPI0013D36C2F|nr:glycoside hydrolase family 28 protein [Mangrovibacterium lignilyticum]
MKRNYYLLIATVVFSLSACINVKKNSAGWTLAKIPTLSDVGHTNLPEEIAAVDAPFETVQFIKPVFQQDTIRVELSLEKVNSTIINKAIADLSSNGGGVVEIPTGEWLTGRVELKSNVNLHIPEGSILRFSGLVKDFQPAVFTRIEGVDVMSLGACIYANHQDNIAVTGRGKLIGPTGGDIRDRIDRSGVIENVIEASTPIGERMFDGNQESGTIFPPMFISPINCTNVYIEGVSLENTAFWNVVPIYCDHVIIRGINVNSVGVPRGDGIDIESSRNVLIEYVTLSCGDDCFTMKAGRGYDGLRVNKPTENVVVRYCLAKEGHGGITVGSETAGVIRNLYIHDCVFDDTEVGIRFKTRRPRGGGGENLIYERIRMNLRATAFKWDMLGDSLYVGALAERLPARDVNELTPKYKNIQAKDILIENCTHLVKVFGIPESPLEDLNIENVVANCSNFFYACDLQGGTFKNMRLNSNDSILEFVDAGNLRFENIDFNTPARKIDLKIEGRQSDQIQFSNCSHIEDQTWFR